MKEVALIKRTKFYPYWTGCAISCINILLANPSQVCKEVSHRGGKHLKTSELCYDVLACSSFSPVQEVSQHLYLYSVTQMAQCSVSRHTTATKRRAKVHAFAKRGILISFCFSSFTVYHGRNMSKQLQSLSK